MRPYQPTMRTEVLVPVPIGRREESEESNEPKRPHRSGVDDAQVVTSKASPKVPIGMRHLRETRTSREVWPALPERSTRSPTGGRHSGVCLLLYSLGHPTAHHHIMVESWWAVPTLRSRSATPPWRAKYRSHTGKQAIAEWPIGPLSCRKCATRKG